jgi:hypothetical protein
MTVLNKRLLEKFLKLAGQNLTGEWILIGGTVLPALGIDHRVTVDIDLIGRTKAEQSQTLKLMELAEELHLPVESINQAGAYFISKLGPLKEKDLVVLHKGRNATIFRPSLALFLRLKIARLSESDLADCLEFIKLAKKLKEPLRNDKKENLIADLQLKIEKTEEPARKKRLQDLLLAIERAR